MREPVTLRSQLSVLVPLLALGCLNPWLYHKLSLTCCHGETIGSCYILINFGLLLFLMQIFKIFKSHFSGDSHGDPERTEAAHHQWQDSPSPSPSHSGHQAPAPGVTRHGHHVIRVSPAHLDQGDQGAEPHNKEKLVNRDLVEMVSDFYLFPGQTLPICRKSFYLICRSNFLKIRPGCRTQNPLQISKEMSNRRKK